MTSAGNYQPQWVPTRCINCSADLSQGNTWVVTAQHGISSFCAICAKAYNLGQPMQPAIPLDLYEVPDRREYVPKWVPKGISYNHFNSMPTPFFRIDMYQFFREMWGGAYAPETKEYRQVKIDHLPFMVPIHIYWFHNKGLGIVQYYLNSSSPYKTKPDLIVVDESGYGRNEFEFYRIGCQHQYSELLPEQCQEKGIQHQGMFDHVYHCEICGDTYRTDSSG